MANPWLADEWNLTDQGQFVLAHGLVKAQEAAKEAGTTVGGMKPKPKGEVRVIERHWIIQKKGGGGGGLIGAGSSGTGGPPS